MTLMLLSADDLVQVAEGGVEMGQLRCWDRRAE